MPRKLAFDRILFVTVMLLCVTGLVMIYSASAVIAAELYGSPYHFLVRQVMALADQVNQYVDKNQPWVLAKSSEHEELLHYVCTVLINAFRLLTLYLKPILPKLAQRAEEFLNVAPLHWGDAGHLLPPAHQINPYAHLMTRIEGKQIEELLTANRESLAPATVASGALPEPHSQQRHAEHQQHAASARPWRALKERRSLPRRRERSSSGPLKDQASALSTR